MFKDFLATWYQYFIISLKAAFFHINPTFPPLWQSLIFNLQAAVERLKRHRDAWQELCRELRRTVVQHEHELKERWLRPHDLATLQWQNTMEFVLQNCFPNFELYYIAIF